MDLGTYIFAAREKPWEWCQHDCCAFPAIWAGMADALPAYTSEKEAETIIREAGGLVALWDIAAEGCADPVPLDGLAEGDVGVIELPSPSQDGDEVVIDIVECGAIWTGRRWAFAPASGGIAAVGAPTVLKAWRPRCPRL